MTQTFTRNRATWLAYLMLALYGYFLNIFGPITPFLKNELNLSYTVSSLHFSAFAVGMIGAGLTGHRIVEKLGRWNSLWVAAFGMSLSALLLIAGRSAYLTIGASFLMGLVGTLILSFVPTVLTEEHGELRAKALSEATVVASVLTAIAPLLVGWFAMTVVGWRAALVVAGLAVLALRFAFRGIRLSAPQASEAPEPGQRSLPTLYWVYWAALVVGVAIEFCMIFWSADYLETSLGMPKTEAAQAVSVFLIGMIIGRVAASRLLQRFSSHQILTGSLLTAAAGFIVYWTAAAPLFGVIGLFITGLGVSSLYPLLLSLSMGTVSGSLTRASATASLASGVAILCLPLILGRLADAVGIHSAYAIINLLVVAALVIVQATWHSSALRPVAETNLP